MSMIKTLEIINSNEIKCYTKTHEGLNSVILILDNDYSIEIKKKLFNEKSSFLNKITNLLKFYSNNGNKLYVKKIKLIRKLLKKYW
jgi:hypothetical protein